MSDLAVLSAGFSDRLRRAGVAVTVQQTGRFARSLALTSPASRLELYWTARAVLVSGHDEIATFDAVFAQVFGLGLELANRPPGGNVSTVPSPRPAPAPPARPPGSPRELAMASGLHASSKFADPAQSEATGGKELAIGIASREEMLARRDFSSLSREELDEMRRIFERICLFLPPRRGRRSVAHRHGDVVDMRATLRRGHASAGDPVRLMRRSSRRVPRRLVVMCDVSASMEPYALAYVHFLHAAASGPSIARAEVFVFATRLTRLTRVLADRDIEAALQRAATAAPDWKGGTRIGEALKTFLDSYGRRGVARGAVVVIMSDGWERDDATLLGEQMARLRRLAHRIVWVNPRSADPSYEPLVGGMAAALPHCDELVSGHSGFALERLALAVRSSR